MNIDYCKYELQQNSALNRVDLSSAREGVLLRIGQGESGYASLQTWPELGDPTVEQCLADLRTGKTNTIVERALHAASLFHNPFLDAPQVQSHATLPRLAGSDMLKAVDADFSAVKVKRGKDWMRLRKKTEAFIKAYPCLRFRFDFNGALKSHLELHQFLSSIPAQQVDFIEDPFSDPELAATWEGFPIAYDRIIPERLNLQNHYLIAKPAIQSIEQIQQLAGDHPDRVIFTSYMDHPLGQLYALKVAQQFYHQHQITPIPLGLHPPLHLFAPPP